MPRADLTEPKEASGDRSVANIDGNRVPAELANLSVLGKRLLAIRERYIAGGGRLYSDDEIRREIAETRRYDFTGDS